MRRLALSSDSFRELAHELSNFAADYLERLPQLRSYPPEISGRATEQLFGGDLPFEGIGAAAFDSLQAVFDFSRPASPRFFGYVFGSGEPVEALGDFAASVLHQNSAAWRPAPAAITIERTVIRWLASAVGCGGFSGSLTLGGSSANLMG
jgi:aromatic-L-amino-acid decarboxylase